VMVPAVPVMVIGRNQNAAWTVTSALDANADLFVQKLNSSDTTYRHDGHKLEVHKQTETIPCTNPPTVAVDALSLVTPQLCPVTPDRITVYRTDLGPAIAGPDAGHHLYVRHSVVDGHLLQSLTAWDKAGRQTSVNRFGSALRRMSL